MHKRFLLLSLLITVAGILFFTILLSSVYYDNTEQDAYGRLRTYAAFFDENAPLSEEVAEFSRKAGGVRVSVLDGQGIVLADSEGGTLVGQSRADRPEVADAFEDGEGTSSRRSATLDKNMFYLCVRLDGAATGADGTGAAYLRIGIAAASLAGLIADAIPSLMLFLLLDILCCLVFAWIATNAILRPVEELTRSFALGKVPVRSKYPELQPIAKMMNDMNAEIGDKVARVKEDRRLEALILDSMEHGIVIFRSPDDVILLNKTASRLLHCEPNETVACFNEDAEIAAILAAGEAASVTRRIDGRDYNLRFTFQKNTRVLLITDITEAVAAARSKNDFIANVTHEMNTPLTNIRGFAELIGSGALPPERVQSASQTIIRQSDRLANLIRSIINFSAIDSDELPDYEVDVSELIAELIGGFEPKIRKKDIALRLDIGQGVKVMSRRERLVEILNNLISNGIRYNKEGGSLDITLTGGEAPCLTVRDTGVGLSEEDKERIFDRFYTVDKSHGGTGGGFGLGLAIVKKLCKRAGWKLTVESELGKGTAFCVQFCPKAEEARG